jgi:hypothetical protein
VSAVVRLQQFLVDSSRLLQQICCLAWLEDYCCKCVSSPGSGSQAKTATARTADPTSAWHRGTWGAHPCPCLLVAATVEQNRRDNDSCRTKFTAKPKPAPHSLHKRQLTAEQQQQQQQPCPEHLACMRHCTGAQQRSDTKQPCRGMNIPSKRPCGRTGSFRDGTLGPPTQQNG